MNIIVLLDMETRDKKGNVLYRHSQVGNSLVGNFLGIIAPAFYRGTAGYGQSRKDTIGNAYATFGTTTDVRATGLAGIDTNGIVVGTGANVVTIDDYALQAKIANGNGAGQLTYGLQVDTPPANAPAYPNPIFMMAFRVFTNNSGGAIVVNEVGMYIYELTSNKFGMIERSVVAPFNIPALGTGSVTWKLSVTV